MDSPCAGPAGGAERGQAGVAAVRATARTNASTLMPDNLLIVPTCGIMSPTAVGGVHDPDDYAEAPRAFQGSGESHLGALRCAAGARARALSGGARNHPGRGHGL